MTTQTEHRAGSWPAKVRAALRLPTDASDDRVRAELDRIAPTAGAIAAATGVDVRRLKGTAPGGRATVAEVKAAAAETFEGKIRLKLGLSLAATAAEVDAALDRLNVQARARTSVSASSRPKPPTAIAAARQRFIAAAANPPAPAGISSGLAPHFAVNPLVENIAATDAGLFEVAMAERPSPPTLFASGDLPTFTASGLDPARLAKVPWYARHAVAEATSLDYAEELLAAYSGPAGVAVAAAEARRHVGNRDYETRVWEWTGTGETAAALREQEAAAAVQAAARGESRLFPDPDGGADDIQFVDESAATSGDPALNAWARQLGIDPKELSGE